MNGITRCDPFQELQSWGERMSRLMGADRPSARRGSEDEALTYGTWTPPVDIVEGKDRIQLKVELPGFKEDQVNLTVEDGLLTIRGERKFNRESHEENYHRIERSYGTFVRSFTLPNSVEQSRIQAAFADGILSVDMPKREETKPKQIPITARNAEAGTGSAKKDIDVRRT